MKNNPSAKRQKRDCPPCGGKGYAHLDDPEQEDAKHCVERYRDDGKYKSVSNTVRNGLCVGKAQHRHKHCTNPVAPRKPLRAAGCAGIRIGSEPIKSPVCRFLNVLRAPNWQGYHGAEAYLLPGLAVNACFDIRFSLSYALRRYSNLPDVRLKAKVSEFQVAEDVDVFHPQNGRNLAQKLRVHNVSSSFRMTCIAPTAIVTSAKRMIPIISISSFFCPG